MKELSLPLTLEAATKQQLIKLMRAAQIKMRMKLHFFDFSYSSGKWHCWYEIPVSQMKAENGNKS